MGPCVEVEVEVEVEVVAGVPGKSRGKIGFVFRALIYHRLCG